MPSSLWTCSVSLCSRNLHCMLKKAKNKKISPSIKHSEAFTKFFFVNSVVLTFGSKNPSWLKTLHLRNTALTTMSRENQTKMTFFFEKTRHGIRWEIFRFDIWKFLFLLTKFMWRPNERYCCNVVLSRNFSKQTSMWHHLEIHFRRRHTILN